MKPLDDKQKDELIALLNEREEFEAIFPCPEISKWHESVLRYTINSFQQMRWEVWQAAKESSRKELEEKDR